MLLLQIMAMSTMKDYERLELLKEIGGTKVYEERRKESLKILQETDNRRSRILEVVGHPAMTSTPESSNMLMLLPGGLNYVSNDMVGNVRLITMSRTLMETRAWVGRLQTPAPMGQAQLVRQEQSSRRCCVPLSAGSSKWEHAERGRRRTGACCHELIPISAWSCP